MSRVRRAFLVLLTVTGLALAQVPAAGNAAGRGPGPGRAGFAPVIIGPPAPVPAEVAIPRPTPAELEQVNQAMKRLIDSDESPAKPLLKKFESLLMLQPPRLNVAATYTQTVAADGASPRRFRRDREEGRYRSPAARRLDHRLVGAGRRQQGDVR